MTPYVLAWMSAFVLTQAVEMPIYVLACRQRAWPRRLLVAFATSALTHPIVWFVIPDLMAQTSYEVYFAVAEGFAVLAEALVLRVGAKVRYALLWALGANAASVVVGELTRALFGWP